MEAATHPLVVLGAGGRGQSECMPLSSCAEGLVLAEGMLRVGTSPLLPEVECCCRARSRAAANPAICWSSGLFGMMWCSSDIHNVRMEPDAAVHSNSTRLHDSLR